MKILALALLLLPVGCQSTSSTADPKEKVPGIVVAVLEPAAQPGGEVIAHVNMRDGYLSQHPDAREAARKELRPLDIIAVSSKNRLSSRFIAGRFTHLAIYLGTVEQLRAAGVQTPERSPHGPVRARDAVFIEAEHDGVRFVDLETVLDTDAVAIMRPKLTVKQHMQAKQALVAHLGTKFDFHMNAADDEKLFCSELVDHTMPWLGLPRSKFYGRDVIFPSKVAELSLNSEKLSFVTYVRANQSGWKQLGRKALELDIKTGW